MTIQCVHGGHHLYFSVLLLCSDLIFVYGKEKEIFFLNKSLEQGSCNPWEQNLCLKEELQQVTRLWANYSCRLLWERQWDTGMSGMLWDGARFPRKPRNNGGGSSRMAPGSQLRSWDEAPEEPFLTGRRAEEGSWRHPK